jgi:hypothetical protein
MIAGMRHRADPQEMARWLKQRERERWSWVQLSARCGHPVWKLRYWQRRLERRQLKRRTPAFVAVELVPGASSCAPIEVTTPSGYRVHVPRDFDADHLRHVLEALKRC